MNLNPAERLLVNNSFRALVQRFYEGPLLRSLGGTVDGGTVLEIGCGRGAGVEVILRQFRAARVFAIDLDPRQIQCAQQHLQGRYDGRFTLTEADTERLPFANETFDAVFDFGALHHVPNWQGAVSEIRRVLKPGGAFFFEEVTRAALERWIYRKFFKHPTVNRFNEVEFLAEIAHCRMESIGTLKRVLFGDIFMGVAKLSPPIASLPP